jgi:hypothetical protein
MIDTPQILEQLKEMVEKGGAVLSVIDRSMVKSSEAIDLIETLIAALPAEMEQAREIVQDREAIIENARHQAGEIVDAAVRKAERLVDADEITAEARRVAGGLMDETDDYVKDKLTKLEEELQKLIGEVRAGIKVVSCGGGKST